MVLRSKKSSIETETVIEQNDVPFETDEQAKAKPAETQAEVKSEHTETKAEPKAEPPAEVKSNAPPTQLTFGGKTIESPLDNLFEAMGKVKFGTFPILKASNGRIVDNSKRVVGNWCTFRPVSYNFKYCITTGDNTPKGKKYFKVSEDGEYLNDGSGILVSEYINELQDKGFPKACVKTYVDLIGLLTDSEDDYPEIGNLVQFNLSPQSVLKWDALRLQAPMRIGMGMNKPEDYLAIKATVSIESFNSNEFSIFNFSVADQ